MNILYVPVSPKISRDCIQGGIKKKKSLKQYQHFRDHHSPTPLMLPKEKEKEQPKSNIIRHRQVETGI